MIMRRSAEKRRTSGRADSAMPYTITRNGRIIAFFESETDRDLCLYFANVHCSMILLLQKVAGTFEYIRNSTGFTGVRNYLTNQIECYRAYAEVFRRLGKPAPEPAMEPVQ